MDGQVPAMTLPERLLVERRARLAAERLLHHKSRELAAANERLALQARALSAEVLEQRQVVTRARSEAFVLKDQNARFLSDLDRAHTAAVMAERRLRDSIDAIRDGFAVFDADDRLVIANRAFSKAFGDTALPRGLPYADMLALAAPMVDTGDEAPEDWAARLLARLGMDPIPPETVKLRSGYWLRLSERRARDGDLAMLAVDITGEMRLLAALDALPDGFVLFDRDDRLVHCNRRYREIFPHCAGVLQPGVRFEDILREGLAHGQHPDALGREEAWLAERLAAHRQGEHATEHMLDDGRLIRAEDKVTPDGGRVGLRRDITGERAAQDALETARAGAEAASRAKSAFLANMSHEIRTPMNGVIGMADLLCDSSLTEEQRVFAETIKSSGEALLVIINDILDYSKLEAERMALHPEAFDLDRMIHEIALLLQPQAKAKGITIASDYDIFLPTSFVGDPVRVRQILTNLMGNAVKFTDHGHVETRVTGFELADGQWQLHLSVDDTGIGIAPDQIDHIFGEFDQADNGASRRHEGTGLGLAIARRLVERMGGTIWADSSPGIGSVFGFRIVLPVAGARVSPELPAGLRRVLVVDEDHASRSILDRQLAARGLSVTLARNAEGALDHLGQGFDLVIADPAAADGDLVAVLRAGGYAGPVLLMSEDTESLSRWTETGQAAGAMAKPVLRADLYRHLSELSPPPGASAPQVAGIRPMRVLVAEDNRTNQLVFGKMVKDTGIDLCFADNGHEAVALWRDMRPDLILMDISMPGMDGRDATRLIRQAEAEGRLPRTPILALTAHAMDGDTEGILAAGLDRHLTKPLRRSSILSVLDEFRPPEALPITQPASGEGTARPDQAA